MLNVRRKILDMWTSICNRMGYVLCKTVNFVHLFWGEQKRHSLNVKRLILAAGPELRKNCGMLNVKRLILDI